ncbi:MAG: TonB-dependent receptor [Betaproteobacteria bacterium]|nr:TonB-dependent receptor [Betaproteobacteria bacterium]
MNAHNTRRPARIANRTALAVAVTAALASLASYSYAQETQPTATPGQLDVIVVTAQRRQERLQDTPIAISVFDFHDLEQRGANNLVDVARIAPNVSLSTSGGGGGSFNAAAYIRGIGQTDWLITTDPGVGVYVDGVFFPRATGALLDLLDVQRVEILRGPQGTLFGRNTIGGAISVVTAQPGKEFESQIEGTLGQYSRRELKAYVDLPASDAVRTRISMAYKKVDGFVNRVLAGDKLGGIDSLVGRVRTIWKLNPAVTLDFSFDATRKRDGASPQYVPFFKTTGNLYPLWRAVVPQPVVNRPPGSDTAAINAFLAAHGNSGAYANPDNPFVSYGTGPNISNLDMAGGATTLTWDVAANLQFKSITAYRGFDAAFGRDADNTPIQYSSTDEKVKQRQFSQEFNLIGNSFDNRLRWVSGLYFFNEHATDTNQVRIGSGLYAGLQALPAAVIPLAAGVTCPPPPGVAAPCAGGAGNPINKSFDLDFDILNRTRTNSYAGFLQATYAVTDQWDAIFGGRYTKDEKKYYLVHNRINAMVPLIPETTVSRADTDFSPKLGVNFKPDPSTMLYTTLGQGFKSGGFNGRPTTKAAVQSFGPEKVTSLEVGSKSEFLNRHLRLNVALFRNDYRDIQLASLQADPTGNLILVVENAGKARMNGLEVELQARPSSAWQVDFSAGYLGARFVEVSPGASVTLSSKLPNTPKWTIATGSSYTFPVGDAGSRLTLRGDATYRATAYTNVENTPVLAQSGYTLLSARAILSQSGGRWTTTAYVTNLSNKRYITSGLQALSSLGTTEAVLGRPREIGITLGYTL